MEKSENTTIEPQTAMPDQTLPEPTSFTTRAGNVFAAPSEVYGEVAKFPVQKSSWVIPLLLTMVMALGYLLLLKMNPTLHSEFQDQQQQEIQRKVAEGGLTQAQADKAAEFLDSPIMSISMFVGGMIGSVVMFFVMAVLLWVAAKAALSYHGTFSKVLETHGIATMIGIFGSLVTMLLMTGLGSMAATPSGALFVLGTYDRHNTIHLILSSLNVFQFWQAAIVGFGLAKIANKPTATGVMVGIGIWICVSAVMVALGLAR